MDLVPDFTSKAYRQRHREFAMRLGDLKGTFYIIRTTTGSWSEAINTSGNRLASKGVINGKTAYFNSLLLSLGGLWNRGI